MDGRMVAMAFAAGALGLAPAYAHDTQKEDRTVRQIPAAEIVRQPRRATVETPMPKEGLYLGSGVYSGVHGKMWNGGFCFGNWEAARLRPFECIDLCVKEQVGNTLQFWQGGQNLLDLALAAKSNGLYSTCIYSGAPEAVSKRLVPELGAFYLGYDFGERYNFSIYKDWGERGATLGALVDEYMNRVRKHVTERQAAGWGNIMATSANFSLDYEIAAGTEVPMTEDYPFGDQTLASALGRGLYRQYNLPLWGSHVAHEWYSWLPHRNPYKMKSLETSFRLKYMTGAKLIINESGNWQLQSTLCEDSPQTFMPSPIRKLSTKLTPEVREKYEKPVAEEARKRQPYIDFRSPVATKYRRIISDFFRFCKEHPAPKGQPEATWALAKGNYDLGSQRYIAGYAVCGAYDLAEKNPNWMYGLPEMSWETACKAVLPLPPMFEPNKNIHFAATPYGQCDIVSFACDNVTAEHLLGNYKVVMFSGWNTCSPKQYRVLCDYVKGGGRLVIGLCHLSTDQSRNYTAITASDLVNGGDLTELCGLRVKGATSRKYWATGPDAKPNCLGIAARRRFGYMALALGDLEYVAPKENFEDLAVDDEDAEPFILRCRNGKGEVFLMNFWAYPAAANMDVGCGAETADVGLIGYLYRYCAKLGRGNVWITGPDFENPDGDCGWIVYSYFPDEGRICLLNLDYRNARKCVLHQFGDKDFITLEPGEFRLVDTVRLDPGEKLNVR